MAATHTWTQLCKPSGLSAFPADTPIVISSSEGIDVEASIAAGVSATVVFLGSIPFGDIKSVAFHSSLADVTFKTADSGGQTITLSTAKALGWHDQMPASAANPITADIKKVTVDNSANPTKATVFRMAVIVDPT